MSAANNSSASTGGSAPLTPANEISQVLFRRAFNHTVVDNLDDFKLKLDFKQNKSKPAVEKWGGNKYDAIKAKPPTDLTKACGGNEVALRDYIKEWFEKILTETENQPAQNQPGAKNQRTEKPASATMLNDGRKEGQLNTVFDFYGNENKDAFTKCPKDPRGSLVTASSKQDLAFYVPTSKILFHGELKNNAKYKKVDAIRQCAGYLFFQLWWFRTVQLKDVEAVYGFTVCGLKCSEDTDSKGKGNQRKRKKVEGEKQVEVSLLILKVPQETKSIKPSIGAKYELYEFSQSYPEDCKEAFGLLGSFLLTDFDNPFQMPDIHVDFSCPGCMLMPPSWLRQGSDERKKTDKTIIKTGTGSLVICCDNKETIKRLLQNNDTELEELQKVRLKRIKEGACDRKNWILKCKTPASGTGWESAGFAINEIRSELLFYEGDNHIREIADKWLDMYPVNSAVDRDAGRSIVVMRYIGDDFSASEISYPYFISEFKMLIDRVLALEKKIRVVHGDIHEGNIRLDLGVNNGGWRLRLIDWDEASRGFATERTAVTDEQKKRYPDCLRELKDNLYTRNQLLLLFSSLNEKYENGNNIAQTQKKQWEEDQGMNWEEWDVELDYNSHSDELREAVSKKYCELYDALDGFENESQGQTTDCFACGCIRR